MLVAFVLARDHDGFAHGWMFAQESFDLARLDPETAHFHLTVEAPDEIDLAGRAIANQIAGLVKLRAGHVRKGIAHESLGV